MLLLGWLGGAPAPGAELTIDAGAWSVGCAAILGLQFEGVDSNFLKKSSVSNMAASLVELSVPRGLPVFRCPVTGIPVWTENGFDETADQSPFIRFFLDWAGQMWIVSPSNLEGSAAAEQTALVATLQVMDEMEHGLTQDGLMRQISQNMPSSAVVFELLDPMNPLGCGGGEICYVGFDFSGASDSSKMPLKLELLDDVVCN